jgi:dolichyl-diphosphooligosaccharide--protein glycosyltransferase
MSAKKAPRPSAEPSVADAPAAPPAQEGKVDKQKKLFGAVYVPPAVLNLAAYAVQMVALYMALWNAFRIRTYALVEFGFVIHEFDPWFNFRATKYLSKHGTEAFFHWFDHMSWYPLGRPVGTTIYPGLQYTSVAIHRVLKMMGKGWRMSLNDVCCYVPAWGGASCTFFMYLFTVECTGSRTAGVISAIVMAVIPAHMMRSVGGGYDNESIAMTAIMMTFYCWIRSLRSVTSSWGFGVLSGLAYGYMVAAWGGYVFVLNMVALHAAVATIVDQFRNVYTPNVHVAYTLFYVIGTSIAVSIPVVGWTPFKSLEQLFALVVFIFLQVLAFSETLRKKADVEVRSKQAVAIRVRCFMGAIAVLVGVVAILAPTGFFGPLSSRVRGLFVQHTRTGNPLVDSVAEHQPASADAYWHYLHYTCYSWQIGIFAIMFLTPKKHFYAALFLLSFGMVAYYFSLRMARLIILAGPVASAFTGFILGKALEWSCAQFFWSDADAIAEHNAAEGKVEKKDKKNVIKNQQSLAALKQTAEKFYEGQRWGRMAIACFIMCWFLWGGTWRQFNAHAEQMAVSFSNPQLMFKSRGRDGNTIMIDDYREAYWFLRDKTDKDARVMAWWDYGYQITGIGERTSIADGNTWNHEHIATLGYCLTSPVKRAHGLIRHIADYVLIWTGGGGDDLAKSPHMARIGNSVYSDICPNDPLCAHFGFRAENYQNPTPMMKNSLLYNPHSHNQRAGMSVDKKYFTEAYTSRHGLVRIFKVSNISESSKQWLGDPANRKCDAPGSWYCEGHYPNVTVWNKLLSKRKDFSQLEDFNKKKKKSNEYNKQYMQRMGGGGGD